MTLSDEERGRTVAEMLICRHTWGEPKKVTVVDPDGKAKPYDGILQVCSACGTNLVDRGDGNATLVSAGGLSERAP